jgi:rare lipoprotein A
MTRCLVLAIAIGLSSSCALAEVKPSVTHEQPSSWITILIPAPADELKPAANATPPATEQSNTMAKGPAPIIGFAHALEGLASYYWQGHQTSSGERFDRYALTAAHRTLPFGTKVRVTNLANGLSVIVQVNDRGPFEPGRVIDLSEAAAIAIGMTGGGITRVRLELVN